MDIIEIIKVCILGVVEGITEWLPVSSTAHMLIVDEFIQLNVTSEFKAIFVVVIQLGAILAAFSLFFKRLFPIKKDMTKEEFNDMFMFWVKIVVGCVPVGITGLLIDDLIDSIFYDNYWIYTVTLVVFGILFIVLENRSKNREFKVKTMDDLHHKEAFNIGVFQMLSLIPGTSRSGSTIVGGLITGVERDVVSEYTFLMAIPLIGGASFLRIIKYGLNFTLTEVIYILIGCLVAFFTSAICIKKLLNYVKHKDFKVFGIYRIVLGIFLFVYFFIFK